MMIEFLHHEDMDELGCLHVDGRMAKLFAVGWLGEDKNFLQGSVSDSFIFKLGELVASSKYTVTVLRGFQPCAFCEYNGMISNSEPRMGGGVLLVPWGADYFLSPDLILHYILEHQYVPPESFVEAVISISLSLDFDASGLLENWLASN